MMCFLSMTLKGINPNFLNLEDGDEERAHRERVGGELATLMEQRVLNLNGDTVLSILFGSTFSKTLEVEL